LGRGETDWNTLTPQGKDIPVDWMAERPGEVGFQEGSSALETEAQSRRETCKWRGYGRERAAKGMFTSWL